MTPKTRTTTDTNTAGRKKEEKKHRGVYEKEPGTGIWWIVYFAEGKKKREKVGRKSDALALYQQRKSEVRAGVKMPANMRIKGETLGQVIDRALLWYASHRPKSLYDVKIHLEAIREDLGKRVADDLTPADVDTWLSEHAKATDDKSAWSPATLNRYKTSLSKALQLALVSGHVKRNVARLVTSRQEDNTRVRWLTDEEQVRLRKVMSLGLTEMVDFALHTGARKGEQFSLTWEDVDLERREVTFRKTKTGGDRTVPMSKTCYQLLKTMLDKKAEGNDFVFQSTRYDAQIKDPKKAFETAVFKADIPDFHWHDLRHSFASRLVMRNVDLYAVSKLMGHSSIAVTQRYAHLAPKHLVSAIEMLDA